MFSNKSLLITGGTGSFGNAVVKSSLSKNFKEIIIFSRDEKKQEEMRLNLNNKKLKFIIGDVRDYKKIEQIYHNYLIKNFIGIEKIVSKYLND